MRACLCARKCRPTWRAARRCKARAQDERGRASSGGGCDDAESGRLRFTSNSQPRAVECESTGAFSERARIKFAAVAPVFRAPFPKKARFKRAERLKHNERSCSFQY